MKKLSLVLVSFGAMLTLTLSTSSTPVYAECGGAVLGIPPWYNNLTESSDSGCDIKSPETLDPENGLREFIMIVALNIIQAALVIVGYITIIFIIKGGFLYVVARGESSHITEAKQTITNAIIGLIIALLAAGIVGAVSAAIGG